MVPPTPTRAPQGREPRGGLVLYYKKLCVILILGFSIVGNSKMISIFILGYPQPLQGRQRGGAWGEQRGVYRFSPILTKIICYIHSGVFKSGDFKNEASFAFRILRSPKDASGGNNMGGRGAGTSTS